jgi:porphobilinogen deaminase
MAARRARTRVERLEDGKLAKLGTAVVGHERVDVDLVLAHVGSHPRLAHDDALGCLCAACRGLDKERDRVADDHA